MAILRGLAGASSAFVAAFALHIVGGASGQPWLFAIAVALIFATATGFPVIALAIARPWQHRQRLALLTIGAAAGVALTASALWAANDRTLAWWQLPASVALVALVSGASLLAWARLRGGETRSLQSTHPAADRP